ncbi:MAG: precorrin-6Y C5,15-methyltransferase (decarboxylating) subunit CbiT [Sarcina sp.]
MKWIKDRDFIRGNCPMTKEEARILAISKMNLDENSRVLDIGTGTGTIAIQCSKIANKSIVYSIERDSDALEIAFKNKEKFFCDNLEIINDDGKTYLQKISKKVSEGSFKKFNSIFIGGTGGDLEEILSLSNDILEDNGNIVLNMITLGNAYKAIDKLKELKYQLDVTHVNVSKLNGEIMMFIANNPIFIIKGEK